MITLILKRRYIYGPRHHSQSDHKFLEARIEHFRWVKNIEMFVLTSNPFSFHVFLFKREQSSLERGRGNSILEDYQDLIGLKT